MAFHGSPQAALKTWPLSCINSFLWSGKLKLKELRNLSSIYMFIFILPHLLICLRIRLLTYRLSIIYHLFTDDLSIIYLLSCCMSIIYLSIYFSISLYFLYQSIFPSIHHLCLSMHPSSPISCNSVDSLSCIHKALASINSIA